MWLEADLSWLERLVGPPNAFIGGERYEDTSTSFTAARAVNFEGCVGANVIQNTFEVILF
jgi:hypothetical protein